MAVIVPTLRHERRLWNEGLDRVAGVDEVGVAPTCGAVVAAAVIMKPGCHRIPGVRDSKTLSMAQRERLAPLIRKRAVAVGVGAASVAEIDQLNIYHATHLAMRRAIARLGGHDHVIVDGNRIAGSRQHVGPYTNDRRRRRLGLLDRLRVGRRQGRPRPDDDPARGPLPGLRLGAQPGLRDARPPRRDPGAWASRRSTAARSSPCSGRSPATSSTSTCSATRRRRREPHERLERELVPVMVDDADARPRRPRRAGAGGDVARRRAATEIDAVSAAALALEPGRHRQRPATSPPCLFQ